MLGTGYTCEGIKPIISSYGIPVLFVWKKTSKLQTCIDSCVLNANTKLYVFHLPCITELLNKLGKANPLVV